VKRASVLATIVVMGALGILVSLGIWQWQRLQWKEDLIAQIRERTSKPAIGLSSSEDWQQKNVEFVRASVMGVWRPEKEIAIHSLMPGKAKGLPVAGYDLITPLRLADGSHILVNRGFVPRLLKSQEARPKDILMQGPVKVTGLLRTSEVRGRFVPDNVPETGEWFTRNTAAIATFHRLERTAPFFIENEESPPTGEWPTPRRTTPDLPNNHLSYALTWFALAILLAIFSLVLVFRRSSLFK
jgi:surfeit locus 1 family protein